MLRFKALIVAVYTSAFFLTLFSASATSLLLLVALDTIAAGGTVSFEHPLTALCPLMMSVAHSILCTVVHLGNECDKNCCTSRELMCIRHAGMSNFTPK